jgi:hypothetical protein
MTADTLRTMLVDTPPPVRLYASCFAYHLRHVVGDKWDEVLAYELAHLAESTVPGLRTIGGIALPGTPCTVSVHASTIIARSRSKAAGEFLRQPESCDVWVSVDEDVYAYGTDVAKLVAAARATRGVVSAPCWLRLSRGKPPKLNFHLVAGTERATPCDDVGTLVDGEDFRTGFGLVAIHRRAIERMAEVVPWVEDEQGRFPALFLDSVETGRWVGEDFAFCLRANAVDAPIHALCDVVTEHAGQVCSVRFSAAGELQATRR